MQHTCILTSDSTLPVPLAHTPDTHTNNSPWPPHTPTPALSMHTPGPPTTSPCLTRPLQVPAAEWMNSVLTAGTFMRDLHSASAERELMNAYASHSLFSHALLYSLFKMWVQQTAGEARPHLALPTQAQVEGLMRRVAAASSGADAAADGSSSKQPQGQGQGSSGKKLFQQ